MKFKIVIICLLFSLLPDNIYAQIDTLSVASLGLNGKIKSVITLYRSPLDSLGFVKSGKIIEGVYFEKDGYSYFKQKNRYYAFDEKQRQTTYAELFTSLDISHIISFSYSNNIVELIEEEYICSDANIELISRLQYIGNKLSSITQYRNGEFFGKNIYKYDNNGYMCEDKNISSSGDIDKIIKFQYNSDGLLISEREESNPVDILMDDEYIYEYDAFGRKYKFAINSYDKRSRWSIKDYVLDSNLVSCEKTFFRDANDVDSKLVSKIDYIYDANNILQKVITYDGTGNIKDQKEYEYNSDRIIITSNNGTNIVEKSIVNGDILRIVYNKGDIKEQEYIYDYTYDINNNWIKIVEYKNTIPNLIRERIIKYYE